MKAVFIQIFLLLFFIALGYIICKTGKADNKHSKLLSVLGFYIFLPANVFKTFSNNFTLEYLSDRYPLVIVAAIFVVAMMLIGIPVSKLLTKHPYQQAIYRYSMISSNYGYVGYTLALALFGEEGLIDVMMFCIPLSVYTYSVGYCMLTKNKLSFKKLLGPVNIALVAGAAVGILGPIVTNAVSTYLPGFAAWFAPTGEVLGTFITNVLDKAQACMGPVSMLLTGMVISEYKLKDMLSQRSVYVMTALRLLVIPLAVCGLMLLCGLERFVTPALVVLSLPCGLNTIVFPKLVGEDCKPGAALACVTSVLCCLTIPFCMWVFGVF